VPGSPESDALQPAHTRRRLNSTDADAGDFNNDDEDSRPQLWNPLADY
jgi:hypothetical protein